MRRKDGRCRRMRIDSYRVSGCLDAAQTRACARRGLGKEIQVRSRRGGDATGRGRWRNGRTSASTAVRKDDVSVQSTGRTSAWAHEGLIQGAGDLNGCSRVDEPTAPRQENPQDDESELRDTIGVHDQIPRGLEVTSSRRDAEDHRIAAPWSRVRGTKDPAPHQGGGDEVHATIGVPTARGQNRCAAWSNTDSHTAKRLVWRYKSSDGRRLIVFHGPVVSLDAALELDPNFEAACYNRGLEHLKAGELQPARTDLTKAIELHPLDAQAFNNRGLANLKLLGRPSPSVSPAP